MLRVIQYFAKSLKESRSLSHSKLLSRACVSPHLYFIVTRSAPFTFTLSVNSTSNNGVTLKSRLGVIQGH